MIQKQFLLNKIKENNGIITTKEALELGVHKDILKELILKHEIIKIAGGLYGLPNEEMDEYIYFSHRVPKGVFSHETAAYLQGLSTRMPLIYVITVMVGDNVSRVKAVKDDVIFKYSKKEYYHIGKEKITNPFGREVFSYDKERTILDLIKDKNRVDAGFFSEAMKLYFGSGDNDLLKLSKYAIYMKMEEQLKLYTEVLLWKHPNK